MIKVIVSCVWICITLAGSVYFFGTQNSAVGDALEVPADYFGGLDYVKLEPLSISIVQSEELQGYLIFEPVFTIRQSKQSDISVPIEFLLKDRIINNINARDDIDVLKLSQFDIPAFQKELVDDLNERLGEGVINEVLIQRIDFLSKQDIRDNQLRRS